MNVPLVNRYIWLTGASSGIGLGLAKALAAKGNTLVLTARNMEALLPLQQSYPDTIHLLPGDVSEQGVEKKLAQALGDLVPHIDTVILNAGNCEYVELNQDPLHLDVDLFERVTQVNYMGALRCLSAALPFLQTSSQHPHVVGVASAASFVGLPRSEAYGGSKAAMRHALQALRLDLAPRGITVSIVYPGFVDTPLTQKNDFPMPFIMDVPKAVSIMIRKIEARRLEITFPKLLNGSLFLLSILPAWVHLWLGKKMVDNTSQVSPQSTDRH